MCKKYISSLCHGDTRKIFYWDVSLIMSYNDDCVRIGCCKSSVMKTKNIQSKYCPCWWPGDTKEEFCWPMLSVIFLTPHSNVQDRLVRIWFHDDIIKWNHFLRYWPFVWGTHRWPVNSSHKGQWRGALMFSLICAWIKGWVKNKGRWFTTPSRPLYHCYGLLVARPLRWFKTPSRPLWCHCYGLLVARPLRWFKTPSRPLWCHCYGLLVPRPLCRRVSSSQGIGYFRLMGHCLTLTLSRFQLPALYYYREMIENKDMFSCCPKVTSSYIAHTKRLPICSITF